MATKQHRFTAADDAALLTGRENGLSWYAIERLIDHPHRACRHRWGILKLRERAKGERRDWTSADNGRLLDLRDRGFSWPEIARQLNRPNGGACRSQYNRIRGVPTTDRIFYRVAKARTCLYCSNPFSSSGAHHRLCDPCRDLTRDVSPWEPDGCPDNFGLLGANPVVEYLKQHDREYQTPEHYAHHKDGMRRHYATLAAGARRLSH